VQRRSLTPRTLILGQVVALLGLVTLFGVYLWLTGQRVLGLLLIGASIAVNGVLLERLADALPRRPLFPKIGYRLLTIAGSIGALTALVEFALRISE
jgi:hypothetical protein